MSPVQTPQRPDRRRTNTAFDRRVAPRRSDELLGTRLIAEQQNRRLHATLRIALLVLLALATVAAIVSARDNSPSSPATNNPVQPAPAAATAASSAKNAKYDSVAKRFDPRTKPVSAGPKTFDLTTKEQRVKVGDKVYDLWTFNGTAPGPVLRAVQGDTITINLTNASSSKMFHSVDFHASRMTMGGGHVQVAPGKTGTFTFKAEYPGVFMYHCATPPVLEHIGRGMYGMIIVQPKGGFGPKMPEYAMVQSELYTDMATMQAGTPDAVVMNGLPNQYVDSPIKLKPNSNVRLFVLNAGPSQISSFHVVGTVFDKVYEDGNPANLTVGRQALAMAASGGGVFEMKLLGEGKFPIVTHQFNHVAKGAVGMMITGDGEPGAAKPNPDHNHMAH